MSEKHAGMDTLVTSSLQRVGPLAHLPAILAEHGVDIEAILAGLPCTAADIRPETFLPIEVISTILERTAAHPGLGDIGLRLARAMDHTILGPIGHLMASCATLREALMTYVGLQIANSTAAAAYLHPLAEDFALGFGIYASGRVSPHIYDASLAVGCNMVRELTGGAVGPVEVLLSRPVPRDLEAYRRAFHCPVRFNESQACLIIAGRDMDCPLPTANAARRSTLLQALQQQMAARPKGFAERVRHVLRPLLLAGSASHRQVAEQLGVHPRTLGRRLDGEGCTFEQLKDEVRLSVARELLSTSEIGVSDIAASLGYATPSAFVRAFRRWTGSSPSAWRRALSHNDGV